MKLSGLILLIIMIIGMLLVMSNILPTEDRIGDIYFSDFSGILTNYSVPENYTFGEWTYGEGCSVEIDGDWRGEFTNFCVNPEPFLGKNVTVYWDSCCLDSSIYDIVDNSHWWIFWK